MTNPDIISFGGGAPAKEALPIDILRQLTDEVIRKDKRGVEALEDWSTRAGDDTDLFVFSHGAWIAQTLQTLLGISAIDPTFSTVVSLRNAHWVRLVPMDNPDGTVRWRLLDYNHGPAIADTDEWERER